MMKPDPTLEEMPGYLIRRLGQISTALFLEETQGLDLTPPQFGMLLLIVENPGRDQTWLGCRSALDRTTVTGVLDRLEGRDLIRREVDPGNRRARLLYPSAAGEALLTQAQRPVAQAHEKLLEPLPPAERTVFLSLLLRLVNANNSQSRAPLRHP
ncbi:MarR family transcriptional regulator [Niveispirillum sp. SYP-B3756]|uniref:MarR family winged helix-turn-helix transcriptional regulator n=1 Tax=Niveispirillum sp. SYP-B3756 TaxID=2662178 RepID=UPI001290BFCE|nr:MarR family transcriptional regulator [Niveispirillum sp. SYP-B3756]MQP67959.1 MarR family transcriptional regulator [Niveispirillum sp. SYP-B3756]